MLTQLDTAIAFVVVMSMLSLLVTAIVQMISALMDLRGKNLIRALTSLFQQVDKSLREAGYNVSPATRLWHLIKNFWSSLTNRWSSEVTRARQLAQAVATHPTVAHGGALAKAVRKDELLNVLKDLASPDTAGKIDNLLKADLQAICKRIPSGAAVTEFEKALLARLPADLPDRATVQSAINEVVQQVLSGASITDFEQALVAKLPAGLAGRLQLQPAIAAATAQVSHMEAGVNKWFDTVMDRASDVFTRWTRVITVAISVLLVVILQIDAGQILDQISANQDLRAALVKMSDSVQTRASETLVREKSGLQAIHAVAKKHAGDSLEADLPAKAEEFAKAKDLSSCAQASQFLDGYQLPDASKADITQVRGDFENECQTIAKKNLEQAQEEFKKTKTDLAGTGLKLVPDNVFNSNDSLCEMKSRWINSYLGSRRHILGTLAMVILLSLGAPFWFNTLRQLSNLKPSISQKVEGEENSDPQNKQGGGASRNRGA